MKQKDMLLILIPIFGFVVVWIIFSVLHNLATTTISEPLSLQITPITPSFDTNTLSKLSSRKRVIPLNEVSPQQQTATASSTLTPIPTSIVVPTSVPTQVTSSAQQGGTP